MLFRVDSTGNLRRVRRVPHKADFRTWKSRLTQKEYTAIYGELSERVEGGEVHTSSWMPGADWTGTVFQPLYERACRQDVEAAGRFFGLILWKVMMDRPEKWSFGRFEKDDVPIEGMTYFRIT